MGQDYKILWVHIVQIFLLVVRWYNHLSSHIHGIPLLPEMAHAELKGWKITPTTILGVKKMYDIN